MFPCLVYDIISLVLRLEDSTKIIPRQDQLTEGIRKENEYFINQLELLILAFQFKVGLVFSGSDVWLFGGYLRLIGQFIFQSSDILEASAFIRRKFVILPQITQN